MTQTPDPLVAVRKALARHRAELLTAGGILVGWILLTWGIAGLTSWVAWPISLGLLCFSAAGWRLLWTLARDGLYALSRRN